MPGGGSYLTKMIGSAQNWRKRGWGVGAKYDAGEMVAVFPQRCLGRISAVLWKRRKNIIYEVRIVADGTVLRVRQRDLGSPNLLS